MNFSLYVKPACKKLTIFIFFLPCLGKYIIITSLFTKEKCFVCLFSLSKFFFPLWFFLRFRLAGPKEKKMEKKIYVYFPSHRIKILNIKRVKNPAERVVIYTVNR